MSKTKRTRRYECAVLWTDHTWSDEHYSTGRTENEATQKLLNKLEKEGATNVSHVTVVRECNEDEDEDEDESSPIEQAPSSRRPVLHPRRPILWALRECLDYADSADAQLIDALHTIIGMVEKKQKPLFIKAQLEDLATEVEPQDLDMAEDLRKIASYLEVP